MTQEHHGYKICSPIKKLGNGEFASHEFLIDNFGVCWQISDEYLNYLKGLDRTKQTQIELAKLIREKDFPGLTKRQKKILKMHLHGDQGTDIAKKLRVTKQSVSKTLKVIKLKLEKLFYGGIYE